MAETFDYVIIGAGSAGSVLVNRLTEDAATSVLVVEAGPRDWHPYIHVPAGFIKTFHDARVNWLYSMEPSEWTGGRRILAPRAILFKDVGVSRRHVDRLLREFPHAVEGTDDPGPCFRRTPDQRPEPAGCHQHVVVHEDDVAGRGLSDAEIPSFVGRQVPVSPEQAG